MKKMLLNGVAALGFAAVIVPVAQPASAQGFLATVICGGAGNDCQRTLDRANRDLGKPAEAVGIWAGNAIAPGFGTAMGTVWELNANGIGPGRLLEGMGGGPVGAPGAMPQQNWAVLPPVMLPPSQGGGGFGNRCQTPFGISFPGPANPIGSVCFVGRDRGVVIQ